MNNRAPGRAVALNKNAPSGYSRGNKIIEYHIQAQSRRHTIGRRVAHEGGREIVVRQLLYVMLDEYFRLSVGCDRIKRGGLIEEVISGRAIGAARRSEYVTLHTRLLGQFRNLHRRVMIDIVGEIAIQVSERVVGKSRQMND